jgi:3-isopropylmalate/(R)-2-methylmalate dehydratase large subunit
MTTTEKILARAFEKGQIVPGENVWVKADILMTHDVCGPEPLVYSKRNSAKMPRFIPSTSKGLGF